MRKFIACLLLVAMMFCFASCATEPVVEYITVEKIIEVEKEIIVEVEKEVIVEIEKEVIVETPSTAIKYYDLSDITLAGDYDWSKISINDYISNLLISDQRAVISYELQEFPLETYYNSGFYYMNCHITFAQLKHARVFIWKVGRDGIVSGYVQSIKYTYDEFNQISRVDVYLSDKEVSPIV